MTWAEHHRQSELAAANAEAAARAGESARALQLYMEAARAEQAAFEDLDESQPRTRGISAVSAISLFYKARDLRSAEALAHRWLGDFNLPAFATDELRLLLQSMWSELVRERAGLGFIPGEIVVSVSGGEIVEGGAPLDLIVQKVQAVQSMLYRTAEMLRGLPHRKRGRPRREIQESVRPWLFQTVPGSYQFAVAVQDPAQSSLFDETSGRPSEITGQFLRVVRASAESPDDLPALVPDPDYRSTFLKLTRNLAPSRRQPFELQLRSETGREVVTLLPATRRAVADVLQLSRELPPPAGSYETIQGVLRAVHLDQDWIEVTANGEQLRIHDVGEAVDDVIGPMVNHPVKVHVLRGKRGALRWVDIEPDD